MVCPAHGMPSSWYLEAFNMPLRISKSTHVVPLIVADIFTGAQCTFKSKGRSKIKIPLSVQALVWGQYWNCIWDLYASASSRRSIAVGNMIVIDIRRCFSLYILNHPYTVFLWIQPDVARTKLFVESVYVFFSVINAMMDNESWHCEVATDREIGWLIGTDIQNKAMEERLIAETCGYAGT